MKRIQRGTAWEIYCTNPEETGRQRLLMGEYSPESLREYFDDVGFEMEDWLWWEMGWRPSYSADIEDFGWHYFQLLSAAPLSGQSRLVALRPALTGGLPFLNCPHGNIPRWVPVSPNSPLGYGQSS